MGEIRGARNQKTVKHHLYSITQKKMESSDYSSGGVDPGQDSRTGVSLWNHMCLLVVEIPKE